MIIWHQLLFRDIWPDKNDIVLLTGPSGYRKNPNFVVYGYRDENNRFRGVNNELLSDNGWYTTHWAEKVNLP